MTIQMTTSPIARYNEYKQMHPEAIILFRGNDLYYTYQKDAAVVSDITGINVLRADGIVKACFPWVKLDIILPKLVRTGYKIAIVEN